MTRRSALAGRSTLGVAMALAIVPLVFIALRVAAQMAGSDNTAMKTTPIVKRDYLGWPNTYHLSNGLVDADVLTDVGPRIIDFRLNGGKNVLYVREAEAGKQGEDTWTFRGGWRLWI